MSIEKENTNNTVSAETGLIAKLQAVQSLLRAGKTKKNEFGGYRYRSAEDILEALKEPLKTVGCAVALSDEIVQVGDRFYVKATARLLNGTTQVSTCAFAREPAAKKGMDEAQITGAASSYARKYALCGLFAIDDSRNDPDATNRHGKTSPEDAKTLVFEARNRSELVSVYKALAREAVVDNATLTAWCNERTAQLARPTPSQTQTRTNT